MRVKQAAEAHRAPSDTARLRLFTLITEAERPVDIAEMARAMALHPNTIRSHLRRRELVGLVTPEVEARTGRGRPRILYKPGPEAEDMGKGARNYKLLANTLAGFVTAGLPDPATGAEIAGRGWGGYLAAPVRPQPGEPVDLEAASEWRSPAAPVEVQSRSGRGSAAPQAVPDRGADGGGCDPHGPGFGPWLVDLQGRRLSDGWITWAILLLVVATVTGIVGGQLPKRARILQDRPSAAF